MDCEEHSINSSRQRDSKGRFVASDQALEKRSVGLRLPKSVFQRFLEISVSLGIVPATLARTILIEWISNYNANQKGNKEQYGVVDSSRDGKEFSGR